MGDWADNSVAYFERREEEHMMPHAAADDEYLGRQIDHYLEEEESMSSTKLLKGVTHTLVNMTKTKEAAEKTSIYGVISLCFGRGDEKDSISQIYLVKSDGRMTWRLPMVTVGGKTHPVFKGQLADELNGLCDEAYQLIKKTFKTVKMGSRYRVANGKVVDETTGPAEAQAGA
jgi:hypothetical protein